MATLSLYQKESPMFARFLNRGSHTVWIVSLAGAILTALGSIARLVPTMLGAHYVTDPSELFSQWLVHACT